LADVNAVKTRLQALTLLDRSLRATTDEELSSVIEAMADDHRSAIERLAGSSDDVDTIRSAAQQGRMNGTLESLAVVLSDACLADCIEQLGDNSDHPTSEQLRDVLPGLVERHGIGITRLMLASTVAGEAPASDVIRDLLKRDELVALPKAEPTPVEVPNVKSVDDPEREALRATRRERKTSQKAAARARREQSARDRRGGSA
jgi:hypothetical protein